MSLAAAAKAAKASYDAKEYTAVVTTCREALIAEGLLAAPAPVVVATPTPAVVAAPKAAAKTATATPPAKGAAPAKTGAKTAAPPAKGSAKTAAPPAKATTAAPKTAATPVPPPAKKLVDPAVLIAAMDEKKKSMLYMVYVMAGAASYQLGTAASYSESESYYQSAIQVNPTSPQAWKGLYELFSALQGDAAQAKLLPVLTELVKNK
jgi:hypothetical protein